MAILGTECVSCHNAEKRKGGLNLTALDAALRGSDDGPVLVPKKPEASQLLKVLTASADPHMPPKRQLTDPQIAVLRTWVKRGAPWNADALAGDDAPLHSVVLAPLSAGYQPVNALAVSAAGTRLAVGRGGHLTLHEVGTTNFPVLSDFAAHVDAIQALAWSPDGTQLVSGAFRQLTWWEVATGTALRSVTNSLVGQITALTFTPDGTRLLAADSTPARRGTLRVLDAATGATQGTWFAHADTVFAFQLSPDAHQLATAGGDRLIKLWDLDTKRELARFEGHQGAVMGVAFNTNGTQLVSVGADKEIKVWDVKTREKLIALGQHKVGLSAVAWSAASQQIVATTQAGEVFAYRNLQAHTGAQSSDSGNERRIGDAGDAALCLGVSPDGSILFVGSQDGVVNLWDREGKLLARLSPPTNSPSKTDSSGLLANGSDRLVRPLKPERGSLTTRLSVQRTKIPIPVLEPTVTNGPASFVRDILPVLSKAGCNAGSCHAKPEGQNGFKLSVFSYDPRADFSAIVKDARGRRVFPAAPAESLLLLKPTLGLPHEGGKRFEVNSEPYQLLVRWLREGMAYQVPGEPKLDRLAVFPHESSYRPGAAQRLRVEAHYSDGSIRDVTRLASFDTNDKEMAKVTEAGVVTVGKLTGQGVIVARYQGLVADAKITVPADHLLPPERYAHLPRNNFIDELAYAHFQQMGLFPSVPCSDSEFLRRASLDTIGVLPSAAEVREFLHHRGAPSGEISPVVDPASPDPNSDRLALIDRLLQHPSYADYWANKYADLLRPNPDRVGVKSIYLLDQWLRESFRTNQPYDQFVRAILTAEGSNHRDGPVVIYRDRREPADLTTMFSQLFLGTRLECARCHHHPNEKWGQEDFYQLAAYFGPLKQKGAGLSPPISAGTESFYFAAGGSVKHPVTGEVMSPRPPDGPFVKSVDDVDPRLALARWLTAPENPFFARALVNRIWANFFGRGLVEPVDDFRISNPCVNPALLDALAADFARHGYDLKHLIKTILSSQLYQQSSEPNETNLADTKNFSRSYRRRLPAEVLLDAVNDITGVTDTFAALPINARAAQTWSYKIDSPFLDAFGRPNSSSDCPCERDTKNSVVQALHLMNSKDLNRKLTQSDGWVAQLVGSPRATDELITELYLATVCRFPTSVELAKAITPFKGPDASRQNAAEDVLWALLNSAEFVFNH